MIGGIITLIVGLGFVVFGILFLVNPGGYFDKMDDTGRIVAGILALLVGLGIDGFGIWQMI